MKNKLHSKLGYFVTGSVLLASVLVSSSAFADNDGVNVGASVNAGVGAPKVFGDRGVGRGMMGRGRGGEMDGDHGMMGRGVFGTVAAVSGNTITVTSKTWVKGTTTSATPTSTTTTYTIDATNAKITKNNVAGTIASILVGDSVMVEGTVTGTNVVATNIHDGVPVMKGQGQNNAGAGAALLSGNGQPVVGGNVVSVNGSTFTITNKSNVTYTVNASGATIQKGNAASSTSAIAVGDSVLVQGVVNANSITASTVIDNGASTQTTQLNNGQQKKENKGFFGWLLNLF